MNYSQKLTDIFLLAQRQAARYDSPYLESWHLLLGMVIIQDSVAGMVFTEFENKGVAYTDYEAAAILTLELTPQDRFPEDFAPRPWSRVVNLLMADAQTIAELTQSPEVGSQHLLYAILINKTLLPMLLLERVGFSEHVDERTGISLSALRRALEQQAGMTKEQVKAIYDLKRPKKLPQPNLNIMGGSLPTPIGELEDYTKDLTQQVRQGLIDPVLGRDKEIARMVQVLSRKTKNNPVLVGEAGVGKTALAYGLAQRIVHGEVPYELLNKRVLELDMTTVVAGTRFRGDFEERMTQIIADIEEAGDVIVFVDEVHTIMGSGAGIDSTLDAANILKPALSRGTLHMVGATTLNEYLKHIEKDAALSRRFAKILVEEPSLEDSLEILHGLKTSYEDYHHLTITDEAVETAVKYAKRYLTSKNLPDSAIDLLDEASARVQGLLKKEEPPVLSDQDQAILAGDFKGLAKLLKAASKQVDQRPQVTVTREVILDTLSQLTGIPVGKMTQTDSQKYLNLEKELHKRVIGQDQAISAVSRAIRRNQSGLRTGKRPIGSFMFLGPTGVGKTELAKALAEVLFDDQSALIRFDMSEYMEKFAASRLNGAPPGYVGYDEGGELTEKVRNKPYSVLLFDEVEKAHPDVFNMFLQLLDDGQLTDTKGRQVDFSNTVVIMTSNLGATAIRDDKTVGFGAKDLSQDQTAMEKRIFEELKKTYRPEFLNRIDEKLVFHSLTEPQLHEIAAIMVQPLVRQMAELGMTLKIQPTAIKHLAKDGYDSELGARPLRRTIQTQVEDKLAELILSGELKAGQTLKIGLSKGQLTFSLSA